MHEAPCGKSGGWVVSQRENNSIYKFDYVCRLNGAGWKTKEKLDQAGFKQVMQLAVPSIESIQATTGLNFNTICNLRSQAEQAKPGAPLEDINYRR